MTTQEFKTEFEARRLKVEAAIDKYLPSADTRPSIVHQAMRYSMEAGGKRIRPMLLLAAHDMFPSEIDPMAACVAIECLHTYSLIHDDLPCMDNSDLRRGKPTCHKQFDEAMALLAGDALLTYSSWLLADAYKDYPKVAAGLVLDLADAGGSQKMIGGQVEDVLGERDGKMTPEKLNYIHHNKTAALITAAVTMGVRLADDYSEEKLKGRTRNRQEYRARISGNRRHSRRHKRRRHNGQNNGTRRRQRENDIRLPLRHRALARNRGRADKQGNRALRKAQPELRLPQSFNFLYAE